MTDTLIKKIGSARSALDNSKSEWAKTYWEIVLLTLLRRSKRLV